MEPLLGRRAGVTIPAAWERQAVGAEVGIMAIVDGCGRQKAPSILDSGAMGTLTGYAAA
ncbi:Uncharacterised protein [Mycobacteroides abscessus subsp. abscessus]|nr:Uncharacterised protein [Mycobacteroides abscessus subsp. abscessus]